MKRKVYDKIPNWYKYMSYAFALLGILLGGIVGALIFFLVVMAIGFIIYRNK